MSDDKASFLKLILHSIIWKYFETINVQEEME